MDISVLLTCHNRKEKTLACLTALFNSVLPSDYFLNVYLMDDGSTDGTEQVVRKKYPKVNIIRGDGSFYWNRGMLHAWEFALSFSPDFVLWLNDDTTLEYDSISRMIELYEAFVLRDFCSGIVVGATRDSSGHLSYGGIVRTSKWHRTKFERIEQSDVPQLCNTMNGNCVLVPRPVFDKIGLLDRRFQHGMGDFDYGLRATKAGFPIWVVPGFVGRCENDNDSTGGYMDKSLSLSVRWKKILGPKGLPTNDWRVFCQRHGGLAWPFYWAWPYTKVLLSSLLRMRIFRVV
jgi:GT2 family glycosyltransferase